MSFSQILFLFRIITPNYTHIYKTCRKEKEDDYINTNLSSTIMKKASIPASFNHMLIGSITVEAVCCIPLFLYAAICLIWMLELRVMQLTVRAALQDAGKNLTLELTEVPVLVPSVLEADITNIIGMERLERSFIIDGIHCEKSFVWGSSGIMELRADYEVRLPVPHFILPSIEYTESMRMKIWNGYSHSSFSGIVDTTVVYVTDTGIVYHMNKNCTYLEPSVKKIASENVNTIRNKSGARYYACGACGCFAEGEVYVTDYGTRYHGLDTCRKIKRTVYAVSLQEVKGKGVCSKCGK